MNHIRELHSILDKENWQIDADNVKVACVSVEASCETTNISGSVSTSMIFISTCHPIIDAKNLPSLTNDSRESDECWSPLALLCKEACSRDVGKVAIRLKDTMNTSTTSVNDSFRYLEIDQQTIMR